MGETCLKLHSQNRTGTYNGIWFYAVSYLISIILVGSFNQYTFNIRMCGDWWIYAYVVSTLVLVVFVTQCTRQIWINFPNSTIRMREESLWFGAKIWFLADEWMHQFEQFHIQMSSAVQYRVTDWGDRVEIANCY